jgi:hypothetical protein
VQSYDEERIRVREALLQAANDDLHDVVTECTKRGIPLRGMATLVEGDATTIEQTCAGTRSDIAEMLRARSPKGELDHIAAHLAKEEPGFLPCVFIVKLRSGAIDFSVVALRMNGVN